MQVQSLGQKDSLEKEMATHSNFLAQKISWTEAGYSSWGHKKLNKTEHIHTQCKIIHKYIYCWSSLVNQMVKNLPAMWETLVRALGWEDPLEEDMETHSVFLPGESLWTEEPCGLQSIGSQRVKYD